MINYHCDLVDDYGRTHYSGYVGLLSPIAKSQVWTSLLQNLRLQQIHTDWRGLNLVSPSLISRRCLEFKVFVKSVGGYGWVQGPVALFIGSP